MVPCAQGARIERRGERGVAGPARQNADVLGRRRVRGGDRRCRAGDAGPAGTSGGTECDAFALAVLVADAPCVRVASGRAGPLAHQRGGVALLHAIHLVVGCVRARADEGGLPAQQLDVGHMGIGLGRLGTFWPEAR